MYIDTDDYAASGIEVFAFPGGEPHANVPKWDTPSVHIFAKIRSWADWGFLNCVGDALHSQGVSVNLFLPYLPGARQDRNTDGLTPLTPRIYSQGLYWARSVTACDPHSLKAMDIYSDYGPVVRTVDHSLVTKDMVSKNAYDFVLAADKGGVDRAERTAERLGLKVYNCTKKRNFDDGSLGGFTVPHITGYGLVVDDICDGGGTFIGISEGFHTQGLDVTLDLFVTHGIFSKSPDILYGSYQTVYTTNSFCEAEQAEQSNDRLVVADLIPYYFGGMQP